MSYCLIFKTTSMKNKRRCFCRLFKTLDNATIAKEMLEKQDFLDEKVIFTNIINDCSEEYFND